MNFAAFSAVGAGGTHFVTTGGQLPVAKLQQNVSNNGTALSQVVGMVGGVSMGEGGVQYVRALEGATSLQHTPQLITVPIALPGAKPGDPQPTVQIQVLSPSMLQAQQQPKYHMQIPIQGWQQGGAVLTVYSSEGNDTGGIQLVGQNTSTDGLQVLTAIPPEMQLVQPTQTQNENKDAIQSNMHQVFITPNQQIIINAPEEQKNLNNNTSTNNNNSDITSVVIKEEYDDNQMDDESSQETESSDTMWQINSSQQDLAKYISSLPPQQAQGLPVSLQQFLRLNPTEIKKQGNDQIEIEITPLEDKKEEPVAEAVLSEDGTLRIQSKKKKKYKKKPPKPARPKPGQVVIATASDGTPIFCCPECQMAYSEKEQLEIHLVVHKIERRFICGICGAGLKRKEHLERHKLGHNPERPYVCAVCRKGFKRREHLNLHAVIHSGVKTEMCPECGKGFYRKDHLRKHARSHESKRARDEAEANTHAATAHPAHPAHPAPHAQPSQQPATMPTVEVKPLSSNNMMPEITIHVPTTANMQVPVQINIPQHVMSSLAAAQQASQQSHSPQHGHSSGQSLTHSSAQSPQHNDAHAQLEALLAQHT